MTCAIPIHEIVSPHKRAEARDRDVRRHWRDTALELAVAGDMDMAGVAAERSETALTVARVVRGVSALTGVPSTDILSKSRRRPHTDARHAVFWLVREKIGLSYPDIAAATGMACHTSVMHGVDRVGKQLAIKDAWFCDLIGNLR